MVTDNKNIKQYCRYCCHCHCGDFVYCDIKGKSLTEKSAKTTNKCKDFLFNEIDVFYEGDMNKVYRPREPKQKQCDGQLSLF